LFGNLFETFSQGIYAVDTKWTKEYGKVFGTYFMTQPELIIADVELLKQILVKDFNNFTNRRIVGGNFIEESSLMARILNLLKDDEWKNVRSTITPAFTSGKMKSMTYLVDDCIETLMQILSDHASAGDDVNIKEKFGGCAIDIIAATAFGTKIDSQRNPDNPFVKYAKQVQSFSFKSFGFLFSIFFPWTAHQLLERFNIRLTFSEAEEFYKISLTKLIEERRKNPLTDKPDFLQLLLNASGNRESVQDELKDDAISHNITVKREPMTTMQIMSQSFLFLIAGYETTAVTLTWVAYMLALNPEEQEKCYEEIKSVVGNEQITFDHIQHRLPYLEAVIAETLRIFPPAPRFDRNCQEEYKVDGFTIPKDSAVSIAAYVIHHDEENYPDPERFLPERFSPEEKAKRNPLIYLPFGYGPRNCIGMRFAQMEMKLILANVIRKFKFLPSDKTESYPPKFKNDGLLGALNPISLKLEVR
jgi:cytochrome P450 family 3 subfamily A